MFPKSSKPFLSILSLLLVLFSLNSCSSSEPLSSSSSIKIGFLSWPGYDIIHYAQMKDMFQKYQLSVELVQYPTREAEFMALKRSEVDALMTTSWDALNLSGEGAYDIILVTDVSSGADGIVAVKEVKSIEGLKGKRISVQKDSVDELVLLEALQKHNMDFTDMDLIDIENERSLSKLYHNEIEAAVLWEPLLSKARKKIGGNILFTTKDVNSSVIDILMVSSSSVKKNRQSWQKFIYVWFDLMQVLERDPKAVFDWAERKTGNSSFAKDYAGLQTGDLALNKEMFSEDRLHKSLNMISELIPPENKVKIMINSVFTQEAMKNWENNEGHSNDRSFK